MEDHEDRSNRLYLPKIEPWQGSQARRKEVSPWWKFQYLRHVRRRREGGEEERRESRGRRNGKEENVSGIDRPWNDRHVKFGFRWKRAQVK